MKKVVINASGGGTDLGVSANGLVEKNITLDISNEIKRILERNGVEVFLLREDDSTISYDDRIKKLKDKYPNPNDVILISNTLNSGGGTGIEVIYPLSKSNTLPNKLESNLGSFNNIKTYQFRWPIDTSKDYYYITRETPGYETIIIRYGYADNAKDANIIKENKDELAESVALSILNYLGITPKDDTIDTDVYIVKKGDTLYNLAKLYDTTVDEIKKFNNLTSNNLSIGQALKIPQVLGFIDEDYYIVKKGDKVFMGNNK